MADKVEVVTQISDDRLMQLDGSITDLEGKPVKENVKADDKPSTETKPAAAVVEDAPKSTTATKSSK